ncbi:MAG TPA: phosphoribosylglycinamide formyltransferase [Pyrinomonadaceae bacterium]|nr:phosphoribosylglycinamide formyltransferase [Pyrinomonadaceae bacterium]
MTTRIAILISGRGSNMVALADAIQNGAIPNAEIALVLSDQLTAKGIETAQKRGLKTYVSLRGGRKREEHEREIVSVLRDERVDLICLAGYMRVLSPFFVDAFRNRILNIHPSLLPSFPGLDAQRQALEHDATVSGCTVHFVDNTLDGGPIIAQRTVPVMPDDTVESLSARILEQEHILYPEAVTLVIKDRFDG